MEIKGINIVWLSEINLSNLNSGEGESNFVDVKKYKKDDIEFPYVSGQAMRFYLKEAIRRDLSDKDFMCVSNSKGETCGDIKKCIQCDLFGFMTTIENKGADVRTSPVKVSPAIGLLPFDKNSNIDFLTRKHNVNKGDKNTGDIVNVEMGTNIYKSGISIDVNAIGAIEEVGEDDFEVKLSPEIEDDIKCARIKYLLNAIVSISDYSKQSRLLTDFTPDIMIISLQKKYNHRLQKAFLIDDKKNVNIQHLKDILDDVNSFSEDIIVGFTSGIINNEGDVKKVFEEFKIKIFTPKKAIDFIIGNFKNSFGE